MAQVGTRVLVQPGGHAGSVRSVEVSGEAVALARAGDTADVALAGVDASALVPGGVLCHPDWPVRLATKLEARIVVLDVPVPIILGRQVWSRPAAAASVCLA
jgi:elongation factor 1 alpha-like protein